MSKPFQFSMRRLFASVALFCVTTGLLRTAWDLGSNHPDSEWSGIMAGLLVVAAIFGLGATIGAMIGNITDAVIGFPLLVAIVLVAAALTFGVFMR
jgi:hypothetical protein